MYTSVMYMTLNKTYTSGVCILVKSLTVTIDGCRQLYNVDSRTFACLPIRRTKRCVVPIVEIISAIGTTLNTVTASAEWKAPDRNAHVTCIIMALPLIAARAKLKVGLIKRCTAHINFCDDTFPNLPGIFDF